MAIKACKSTVSTNIKYVEVLGTPNHNDIMIWNENEQKIEGISKDKIISQNKAFRYFNSF